MIVELVNMKARPRPSMRATLVMAVAAVAMHAALTLTYLAPFDSGA